MSDDSDDPKAGNDRPFRVIRSSRDDVRREIGRVPLPGLKGISGILAYFGASLLIVIISAIFAFPQLAAHVNVNIWWFQSVQLGDVYGRMWDTQKNLFLFFALVSYLAFTFTFFATRAVTYRPGPDPIARRVGTLITLATGFAAAGVAMIIGHTMADQWQQFLLATHSQSFGITDPVHHRDIGFYVFQLPWRQILGTLVVALLFLCAIELAALATLFTITSPYQTVQGDVRRVVAIGSLFGAILFGFLAWRNFYLLPYDLQQPGTAYGGGATFVHASLWWYPIVGVAEIITAIFLLANTALRRIPLVAVAVLPIVVGIISSAGQGIFQHFVVSPNELAAENTYLGYTLGYTRHAYGIDQWKVGEYTPHALTFADVANNQATVNDARIADQGAVTQVLQQRQENRLFYGFNTANIDRYTVAGAERQVLLAARELVYSQLPLQSQTWVNQHAQFTHGYGLTMAPANQVTRDGQPVLWIENVPVQETIKGLPAVKQPRIYFGQATNNWILTNTTTTEFDFSTAFRDLSYRYQGPDGVTVGSGLRRLTLAWVEEGGFPFFNNLNISKYVRDNTRILFHRNIVDRVQTIAPWLTIDSNPYLVLRKDGSLVWMMDGMTGTDHYPYSDPINGLNYQRNSVKIVLDAYTGRTTFYAFDSHDPILRAWSAIFPGLLHPFTEMPADLKAHIKYPDDYLNWQAAAYQRYHVTDTTSYYNGDNQWDVETSQQYDWNSQTTNTNTLQPIWTVARLFGEKHDSFFSILPFSVSGKATMAGYIAADNNTYKVTALDMPRGAQTMGVTQFESLYQQAPAISQTLTLLDQHGSQVVAGNILILPTARALLYIKPLYLRSQSQHTLPQLIRVVVGTQNAVNWGFSLKDALNNLLTQGDISNQQGAPPGTGPGASPTATPSPVATPPASGNYAKMTDAQLLQLANAYYLAAQQTASLTEKDRDLKQLGLILQVLRTRHPH
jgi:uncharacterized membrane protein (UPF0182 family)